MYPRVILSANVSHYSYTAQTLYQAGLLRRYLCAISIHKTGQQLTRLLPDYWEKKLAARNISEIDKRLVRAFWLPEILQRGLPALRLISKERGNWINDHLYDWMAQRWVTDCDVFHTLPGIGLCSAGKARRLGSIIICDERQEYPDFQTNILREEHDYLGLSNPKPVTSCIERTKAVYYQSDYIVLPSSYAKDTFVHAGFKPNRIFVLPYGVDPIHFTQFDQASNSKNNIKSQKYRILYVGSVIPRKGVHYLTKAFEELHLPNSELLVIGSVAESMRPVMQHASQKNPNIRLRGPVPKIELKKYYNEASVFVLPSLSDSYGLVCLEAMACGLPVIVTQNTGSKEAVQDGHNGFIIPIRNVELLKEKLSFLYENPNKRLEMGKSAAKTANSFTWEKYGENLLNIYSKVLGIPISLRKP